MPNRILKDSICTSPNVDMLSRDAEVFFYRLLVQCDDFGRMDARLPILRAKCYPLQVDKVTAKNVGTWLTELTRADLVELYAVEGKEYLQVCTWEHHQQVRAKRSKYPAKNSSDTNGYQLISDAPENPIRIQSESESESESEVLPVGKPAPTPKPPASAQQDMFGAISETCELDPKLKAGMIAKNAKELLAAGYTPEQVRGFKAWWQSDDWRMRNTPVPSIAKLTEQLQQFRNQASNPRTAQPSGNGRVAQSANSQIIDAYYDRKESGKWTPDQF